MTRSTVIPLAVIPDLIRDPVRREPWIADQVRNDKTKVVIASPVFIRPLVVIPDLIRDPCLLTVPRESWIADQGHNDKSKAELE